MARGEDNADGLLRRADIEIEHAHLVLRLARRVDTDGHRPDGRATTLNWFQGCTEELLERVTAADRHFVERRLAHIAETIAGIDSGAGADR